VRIPGGGEAGKPGSREAGKPGSLRGYGFMRRYLWIAGIGLS